MLRRLLMLTTCVALCAVLYPRALDAEEDVVPYIDLHVDLSYRSLYKGKPFSLGSGQYMARALNRTGVRGVVLPLYLPEDASPQGRTRAELERSYAHVFRSILETPPYSLPGCSIGRAGPSRRSVETWLAFEGSAPVGADLAEVRKWVLRGVRSFGLVHSIPNTLATSSGVAHPEGQGLSAAGRRFVEYVFNAGGLIDVSHASDSATDETLRMAEQLGGVVIATHSNARRLAPHPRNLTDEHIERIARLGGVIGVNFHQRFLSADGGRDAELSDVVQHIKYLLDVAGPDAVALGSDFEGGIRPVAGLENVAHIQTLAQALIAAGVDRAQVRAVFSENARRALCSSR